MVWNVSGLFWHTIGLNSGIWRPMIQHGHGKVATGNPIVIRNTIKALHHLELLNTFRYICSPTRFFQLQLPKIRTCLKILFQPQNIHIFGSSRPAMDSLDLDLESLGVRHGGASSARCARHAVILLLTAAVVICVLVDRREDGDAATRRDRRETALQEKYATDWKS